MFFSVSLNQAEHTLLGHGDAFVNSELETQAAAKEGRCKLTIILCNSIKDLTQYND